MLFIFRQSDVFCYGSGLMDPSKMRTECMNKKQFIDSITQIWEVLEVQNTLEHLEGIFISEETSIPTDSLRLLANNMQYSIIFLRKLDENANNLLSMIDTKGFFAMETNNALFHLLEWIRSESQSAEAKKTETTARILRTKLISHTPLAEYYAFLAKLNTAYQVADLLSFKENLNPKTPDNYFKINLDIKSGYNTDKLRQFLDMMETSTRFLCEQYGVEYEPLEINSIETGSLEFVFSLPEKLYAAASSTSGAPIVMLIGIMYVIATKRLDYKLSLSKYRASKLEEDIKQEQLKEARLKTVNSTLQVGLQISQLGESLSYREEVINEVNHKELFGFLEEFASGQVKDGVMYAIAEKFFPDTRPKLLTEGKSEAEPDEGKSEAELAEEELDAELKDRLDREP